MDGDSQNGGERQEKIKKEGRFLLIILLSLRMKLLEAKSKEYVR